jgi:hypothetical protein
LAICCVAQLIVHLHLAWLCTILPISSCSSFAHSKYLQIAVNMDGPRCAQGGMLVLYLFGISKNPRHFSPSPQRRCLVHHLHSGMS